MREQSERRQTVDYRDLRRSAAHGGRVESNTRLWKWPTTKPSPADTNRACDGRTGKAAPRLDIHATTAFGRSTTSNPERARLDRGPVQFDPLQYIDSALSRRSP